MAEIQENPTTVDGVRAIEMRYRPIWSSSERTPAFYQSSIRLNSPDMGVLLPERFMNILESDDRSVSVFKLALLQTLKAADKFIDRELDFGWISVFIPLRLLRRSDCVKIVREFTGMLGALPGRICFELPASLIDMDDEGCSYSIQALRKAGFHTMLTGVGGESFPMLRLAELEPEYVMLNESITRMLGVNERSDTCVKSVISFINELGGEPVAAGVCSFDTADKLYELECSFYAGDESSGECSGKFMAERFIRRRNSNQDTAE